MRQGAFKTDQGANVWNVTGGNYILYADNVFNSDVQPLNGAAEFIYGEDSTTRPVSSFSTSSDFVVLRQSIKQTTNSVDALRLVNDIQAVSQQSGNNDVTGSATALPILVQHVDSPYIEQTNATTDQDTQNISLAELDLEQGDLENAKEDRTIRAKNPVRSKETQGIGLDTGECVVVGAEEIICEKSSSE